MKKETPFYLRHFRHIAVLLFLSLFSFLSIQASVTSDPVSYTHLDVYKRQVLEGTVCISYHNPNFAEISSIR